jgi:hypothetical protein
MIRVYQTIVDKGTGNCMQAAIASLLNLQLNDVPNFKELGYDWFSALNNLLNELGYEYEGCLYNYNAFRIINERKNVESADLRTRFNKIKEMEGVDGYFYASVYSPKYYNVNDNPPITHAVIINKSLDIVHDVNPEYVDIKSYPEQEKLKYNGILNIFMINPVLK